MEDKLMSVDTYLTEEMLHEDHMDFMLDESDNDMLHQMLDDSIESNLFYGEEDLSRSEDIQNPEDI